ncbi:DUF4402 domain-containing protein [Erythrobacter sp. GH1-10]|uniref:DUF4402 domain-containing protein n=1 Tax=Erythrobacter sp. GH1-10 TaxID=3349334 RepID=UPI003877F7D8
MAVSLLLVCAFLFPVSVRAAPPEVRIVPDRELSFGSFMVFGSGSRTISANGGVIDVSIVPLEGNTPVPAHFTVLYDRGNNSRHVIDVELELVMSSPVPVRVGGVEGKLSAFETDLPQALRIRPGQAIRISLPNCRTRVCSQSFQLGARLDVTRDFGGASIVIPIPFDVAVISVDRDNPGRR